MLYQRFRDAFYGWKKDEFPITTTQKQALNQALAQLAFTALERQMSLRESLCEEVMGEAAFKLAQEIGWLNFVYRDAQTNEPVYAFFHLTFQEYFAALAVPDWQMFLTYIPNNSKQGIYRIFEPQWKEVILLWLGRVEVPGEQKEEFITALVEFEDGIRELEHHNGRGFYEYQAYFLAAAGVGEFKKSAQTEEIVRQIVKWGFGEFDIEKQKWITYLDPIREGARAILPQTHRPTAITALVELIGTSKNEYTRRQAVESLGNISTGNLTAITALEKLISTTEDESTRRQAAESLGKIDPGNEIAIATLEELISTTKDESTRRWAADSLGEIGTGNDTAIATLEELIGTTKDESTCYWAAETLEKIDPGNPTAITALVELIGTTEDESTRRKAADSLKKMLVKEDQRAGVVSALKGFLSDETYKNNFGRFDNCYEVIWHCAQNLPYPTFYEAWHHPPATPHPEVDAVAAFPALTLSQLPQLLGAALTSLNFPVESVLCIDGSKFENPDNPALEIYAELVWHGFPERQAGEPATTQQLKVYCQLKCRNLFLVFYEDPTSPPPQEFSPIFLSSLSKFAQVNRICVVSDQGEIPVQSFSASDPNLISEIVAWMERMGMEE